MSVPVPTVTRWQGTICSPPVNHRPATGGTTCSSPADHVTPNGGPPASRSPGSLTDTIDYGSGSPQRRTVSDTPGAFIAGPAAVPWGRTGR